MRRHCAGSDVRRWPVHSPGPIGTVGRRSEETTLFPYTARQLRWGHAPDWLDRQRRVALDAALRSGLPSTAEEMWRYSRVDAFPVSAVAEVTATVADAAAPLGGSVAVAGCTRVDGHVLGSPSGAPVGASVRVAGVDDEAAVPVHAPGTLDAFAELAVALCDDVVLVEVAPGTDVADPIELTSLLAKTGATTATRTVVRVGAGARVTIVERRAMADADADGGSAGERAVFELTELLVGDGAEVRYVTAQEYDDRTWSVARCIARTGRDATLRMMAVALGGSYARMRIDASLDGPGAHNELLAVYFGDGTQMHDFRTVQDHLAPRTTSELLFNGAVGERSRSVYSGLIRIGEQAARSVANQTNRNLLLSPEAAAESVPNLEILHNDVSCSHGSTVGPIDADQRYYLESRGVPPEASERLVVLGFFRDLLDRLPDAALAQRLGTAVAAKFHVTSVARAAIADGAGGAAR